VLLREHEKSKRVRALAYAGTAIHIDYVFFVLSNQFDVVGVSVLFRLQLDGRAARRRAHM